MSGRAIGAVAEDVGLDVGTLRYFERRGVLPTPPRDAGGRRIYDEDGVHLIRTVMHLRLTGMPLRDIAAFTALEASDADGAAERLALLTAHLARVLEERAALDASIAVIEGKIRDYGARVRR